MNLVAGIAIACTAGVMNGIFPLPMKANRDWAWENNWLPFSFLSLAVFPCIITWWTVPCLAAALQHASPADLLLSMVCGALVYTGSLLFGISLVYAGLSLSFALLVGSMNIVGVLVSRLLLAHSLFHSTGDWLVLVGVALSVVSVVLGFLAHRAKQTGQEKTERAASKRFLGSVLATLAGVLSGLLPVAIATPWAQRLFNVAIHDGRASSGAASNAALSLILLGGAIPNCTYCLYLLVRNRTCRHYRMQNRRLYWAIVLAMALLYSASVALWGIAVSPSMLGALGSSVGWALFVGMIVISSTACGLLQGEWRQATATARALLGVSLTCLLTSMVLISFGNYYQ